MKKLVSLIFLLISSLGYSYLQLYPLNYDRQIDEGGEVIEYQFSNPTSNKLRYIIYIEEGKSSKDMSKWIEYYPKSIILNPQEKKSLKVYISSPEGAEEGEYTAILGVKELPVVEEKLEGSKLSLLADVKLEIAGFVGEEKIKIREENLSLKKEGETYKFNVNLKNQGNRRANLDLYLENPKTKEVYLIGRRRIMKNEEVKISKLIKKDMTTYSNFIIKIKDKVVKRVVI